MVSAAEATAPQHRWPLTLTIERTCAVATGQPVLQGTQGWHEGTNDSLYCREGEFMVFFNIIFILP